MKKLGLVGLGTIAEHYLRGFCETNALRLCAVCDANEHALSAPLYGAYPFYNDMEQMLKKETLDCVLICTPPKTHEALTVSALSHGVDVLLEKPVAPDADACERIFRAAEKSKGRLDIMFHWRHGIETLAFTEIYDPKKIEEIRVTVLDPYSEDGITVKPEKRILLGAWIDSGVNALSMIQLWLPFCRRRILETEVRRCKETGQPLFAHAHLEIDGIPVFITVDWCQGQNKKTTTLTYEGRRIELFHSAQQIIDGKRVTDYGRMERLDEHYYTLLTQYGVNTREADARAIHKLLYEVNERL